MISGENQALGPLVQAKAQGLKGQPLLQIGDQEIYILSPVYRLRNSKFNRVLVFGAPGFASEPVDRATAVVLALSNGKRSVADIARITRPLVKIADDAEAIETAKKHVKLIIHTMSRTREERDGQPRKPREFQAPTVLIAEAVHDRVFGHRKFTHIEYRARDFLPRDPSEMTPDDHCRREHAPVELIWHLTSDCSTDCRYCYLGKRKIKPLPKERMLSLIEEAAAIGVVGIYPTGADSLLYPHLEDALAVLRKHKFLPIPLSTKSFLGKEKAKLLAENTGIILAMQFSIDSTVGDVADYLVRSNGFCDRIFKSIDNALEAGLCVDAKVVITPYNILTIPKLYRDLKKRGVSVIRLATYFRSAFHHSDDLFNHPASYEWLEEQVKQLQQEFPNDFISIQNGGPRLEPLSPEAKQKAWRERGTCTAGRYRMMICADGKVIPCEQMPETEEYFCGDVSYQSIQEVWDGARLREFTYGVPREKFKGQPCYDCGEWEKCIHQEGICIRDLAIHHGSMYLPPPECTKHNRSYVRTV